MARLDLNKYQTHLVLGLIIAFTLFGLWIRALPASTIVTDAGVNLLGNDPWYHVRQVEHLLENFPRYAWFDPMTHFPDGEVVYWGPLFNYIIAGLCILFGAGTRPEIMYISCWVPALMGAAMVPIMYLIGAAIADRKTGVLAAGFITVVGGTYFYRSIFGFVDHHIGEVLFGTIFVLAYIAALAYSRRHPVDLRSTETLMMPGALALLAGFAYFLGILVMPTMALYALIVAVFTLIQFLWDFHAGRSSDYLLVLNAGVFAVAILGIFALGIPHASLSIAQYSIMHVYIYLLALAGTIGLYTLGIVLKGRAAYFYPASVAGIAVVGTAAVALAVPDFYTYLVGNFVSFFGSEAITLTVQEAQPWSYDHAWRAFHWSLPLMAGGFVALVYRSWREESPALVFGLVWSGVMLVSTIAKVRYEYYLAANVALLAAVFIGFVLNAGWKDVRALISARTAPKSVPDAPPADARQKPSKKERKSKKQQKAVGRKGPDHLRVAAVAVVAVLGVLFVAFSLTTAVALASSPGLGGIDSQWREALDWFGENTPDPGIDYYGFYEREAFDYPPGAYGVMSWWDYGHWITFVSQRIPNSNPFQRGVAGPTGSAAYFMSPTEEAANAILDDRGSRYVITDFLMANPGSKFWAMATWANSTAGTAPYLDRFLTASPTDPGTYNAVSLNTQEYYETMVARLHIYDGSMAEPDSVWYIEYRDAAAARTSLPVITRAQQMNASAAADAAAAYNKNAPAGQHATIVSNTVYQPLEPVPALQHYRLVFESSRNVLSGSGQDAPDIRYVKIFEYVPGARISGEGIIELPLVTSTGREFTYRQESVNGEFVVPYATSGGPESVTAKGPYRIAGTTMVFEVSEEDIQQGRTIR
ncbi:MAG: oligosaccharyl transferase, archaeosortase A system-associated [Methanomicrobiaceae archaeon]|uniref:Oligosaccharyl transferase n=1 Tax=hydrocarbon metagenome TaxID=938273 RepID=A0A0W8FI39_9ZZZZ|nr:oligosaccharyl transferase, archaeosortase A system-associated [Methanomicrobiaceae archaeon]MDD5420187.1 oligosaccharyl transferase, archaeosortase A system-associated [Methanomicrobiaceae archaeon]